MSQKVVLRMSDELAEKIESECTERREQSIESLEAHGWDRQAEQLRENQLETTAEKTMFLLQSEVSE